MFGKNILMKVDVRPDSLLVHSIFPTIQGEGPYAGQPAVFLRLGGCSLACSWCDTEFEEGVTRIETAKLYELLDQVRIRGTPAAPSLCVITGGEPMRQNLVPIIRALISAGWRVQVETAGIHWGKDLDDLVSAGACDDSAGFADLTFVCSPKTSKVHPRIAQVCTDWKYIVSASEQILPDGLPCFAVSQAGAMNPNPLYRPPFMGSQRIYVQPLDTHDEDTNEHNRRWCVEICLSCGYFLSQQQHKTLGLQ